MSNIVPCGNTTFCSGYQGACFVNPSSRGARGVEYARKNKGTFAGLAITQIVLGICLVGIGISAIPICSNTYGCGYPAYDSWEYYYYGVWTMMSASIWGGALVILFAVFGLVQVCSPSSCTIGTNLGLSIVGTIFTPGLLTLEVIAACVSWRSGALIVLHSIGSGCFFVSFILFIVNCSYAGRARGCCTGCCDGCCDPGQQEVVAYMHGGQPQVVTLSNGQTVVLQAHPQNVPGPSHFAQPPQYNANNPYAFGGHVPGTQPPVASGLGVVNQALVSDLPPKV